MKATYNRTKELEEIFNKIVERFGYSKYYTWLPELFIYHDDNPGPLGLGLYGEFCSVLGEISINLASHKTFRSIVKTMLHEYCHYLQHPGWYTRYENKYLTEMSAKQAYRENPYEKAAWDFADEYIDEFVTQKR